MKKLKNIRLIGKTIPYIIMIIFLFIIFLLSVIGLSCGIETGIILCILKAINLLDCTWLEACIPFIMFGCSIITITISGFILEKFEEDDKFNV
jgi:hypothetical protein